MPVDLVRPHDHLQAQWLCQVQKAQTSRRVMVLIETVIDQNLDRRRRLGGEAMLSV